MLDMLGFNAIQVSDEVGERYALRFAKPREHWFQELCELLKHAEKLGLHRILFMWGASIGLPAPEGAPHVFSSRGFNPYDPDDKPVWEDHLSYLSGYAPYIDELLTHWGDPGGFEGATIQDAQRIHMRIWEEFKKKNPALRSIFSLWMLHHAHYGRWSGYEGPETIIKDDILPKEVSLAMHARINPRGARLIKKSGRRCGPWVWYMADNEIFPGLHVHTGWLEEYFQSLPHDIGEAVEFHGVEMNCHQLNYPSVYVAARKLWDPYEPANQILSDFCHLAFGPHVGETMLQGYRAIAHTRCVSDYGHRDVILGRKSDIGKTYIGNPKEEGEEAQSAVEALGNTEVDENWIPRLPLPTSPKQMMMDLKIHLQEIMHFIRFRMDLAEVEAGRKSAEELADWQRPDGYLLKPEMQQVQQRLRELLEES
jgi:hypothetical protein